MLVGSQGFERRLHITLATVKAVHKNGLIVLEGSDQKYRKDGSPTGDCGRYGRFERLQEWDDALWQEFQRQEANVAMALKLCRLADKLDRMSRNDKDGAAKIWETLPLSLRQLVEEDQK